MEESKGREGVAQASKTKGQPDDRRTEATNDETLSELEKDQKIDDKEKAPERDIPSPDSEPSKPREERGDAGPM